MSEPSDKPDGTRRRRRWRLWTGIVVASMLLLYVFTIGPAFRRLGPSVVRSAFYQPLIEIARFEGPGDLEAWYLTAWSRDRFVKRSPENNDPGRFLDQNGEESDIVYIRKSDR
jgi:hypothetical protein